MLTLLSRLSFYETFPLIPNSYINKKGDCFLSVVHGGQVKHGAQLLPDGTGQNRSAQLLCQLFGHQPHRKVLVDPSWLVNYQGLKKMYGKGR